MPFYEYECEACGEPFVALRSMEDRDAPHPCPACGSEDVRRKVSAFATAGGSDSCPATGTSCDSGFG